MYYTKSDDYNLIVNGYLIDLPLSTSGNIWPTDNNVTTTYNQQDHTITMRDIGGSDSLTLFLNGNGDKYLADDGTYKAVSIPAATTTTIGGITEPDDTKYFGDTFVDGLNGTVLATTTQKKGCPFTLQWDGDDGIRTATYSVDSSGETNVLNLADNLVANSIHECEKSISTVTAELSSNNFCIEYQEMTGSTSTCKFIHRQNSPFQIVQFINSNAISACITGQDMEELFYTLSHDNSSVHIHRFNGQDTTINIFIYAAIIGGIPMCFDIINGSYLAIEFNESPISYTLVSYNDYNNTKTTIADITNYLAQAGNVFPINLFFSNNKLYVLASNASLSSFTVIALDYSGGNVNYLGNVPLGTNLDDPVSVVQINFMTNSR